MSLFAATLQRIEKIWAIDGADAIELVKVENYDYQMVTGKNQYSVGEIVVFFPVESVLPPLVIEAVNMVGKFAGSKCDRVKTKVFRKQPSQGFVAKVDSLLAFLPTDVKSLPLGTDVTAALGVVKYEPPTIPDKAGDLLPLPDFLHGRYDIESCQNFPAVVESLMDQKIVVMEKLEGVNSSFACNPSADKFYVSQRNYTIKEKEGTEHSFWRIARQYKIEDITRKLSHRFGGNVVLRAEMIGPGWQGNIYKLAKEDVRFFDIMINDVYAPPVQFEELCREFGLTTVPIIAKDITLREWLAGRTIDEAATGESVLYKTLREGVVIKPMVEQRNYHVGRCIIKHRSILYLSKTEL